MSAKEHPVCGGRREVIKENNRKSPSPKPDPASITQKARPICWRPSEQASKLLPVPRNLCEAQTGSLFTVVTAPVISYLWRCWNVGRKISQLSFLQPSPPPKWRWDWVYPPYWLRKPAKNSTPRVQGWWGVKWSGPQALSLSSAHLACHQAADPSPTSIISLKGGRIFTGLGPHQLNTSYFWN